LYHVAPRSRLKSDDSGWSAERDRPQLVFTRSDSTYDDQPDAVRWVLADEASPLNRIAKLIPDGSCVLDIGAGNGLLARLLHETHQDIAVDGIEPNRYAAALAAPHYRRFHVGFAEDLVEPLAERYDFIVLADVVEHIADPLAFLGRLTDGVPKETRVIIDTPNVAFGAVRLALLKGRFDYVDSGLLERTHLRFFTLATLERLVAELGLNIEKLCLLQRSLLKTEIPASDVLLDPTVVLRLLRDELASTYQFLLVLTREDVVTEREVFGERLRAVDYLRWRVQRRTATPA
jgi:2-polyprenyl-3-methyl-5-hydroxy-6-metoxy-1,4-benzoquinol methylase